MKKVIKQKNKYLKKCEDGTPLFGSTSLPMADSNMLQGYDSGMSSYPDFSQPEQKQGMSKAGIAQMAGGIAGGIGSSMGGNAEWEKKNPEIAQMRNSAAQTNPFVAMGKGFNDMVTGIGGSIGGEKGRATAQGIVDPLVAGLSHLKDKNLTAKEKFLYFLPFGNLGVEEENPLFDKKFEEKLAGSNISFGQAQAKYGMPLFKNGGKVEPIYTDNPKDKRLQAYNDSLSAYTSANKDWIRLKEKAKSNVDSYNNQKSFYDPTATFTTENYNPLPYGVRIPQDTIGETRNGLLPYTSYAVKAKLDARKLGRNINPFQHNSTFDGVYDKEGEYTYGSVNQFKKPVQEVLYKEKDKKPVQPVIYKKKEEVKVPIPKKKFTFPDEQEGNEEAYQSWRKTLPKNLQYEGDYDLKGFYKENPNFKAEDKNQHLTDKYKLPNHPTFSVESKYYKEGMPAGKWDGDDYIPINRGNPLPDYLTQTVKTPMGTKTYKRKDDKSPWMEQYAMGGLINNRRNFNAVNDMMADSIYSPDGKFFSTPEQYQQYQSFYNPQPQLQQPIMNNYGTLKMKSNFRNNSFFALGGEVENSLNKQASRFEPIITTQQKTKNSNTVTKDSSLINSPLFKSFAMPLGNYASSPIDYQKQLDLFKKYGTFDGVELEKLMNSNQQNTDVVKHELGGDPRAQSNIEAEQGEAMQHSSGKIENIEGQKHENGGTPLQVQPSHEYIYSDSLGYDREGNMTLDENLVRYSFADNAKKIERKYKGREMDSIVQKTKELELGKLKQDAEQARVAKEQIDMTKKVKAKYGANLKKFYGGGTPFTEFPQLSYDEQVDPKSTLFMQNQILQQDPNALPKYGADGLWGKETQTAMDNSPFGPRENLNSIANISPMVPKGFQKLEVPSIDTLNFGPKQIDSTINPKEKRNGLFQNLTQGDKLQLAGMLPGTLYNIGMGLKKAEKEHFYKNPYNDEIMSMMANRRYDPQSYLNEASMANTAMNQNISDNSTSVGVKLANMQKGHANFLSSIADITGKSQELNNNYRAQEATVKGKLGEVLRQEGVRVSGVNAQNKAAKQAFMAKGITQLGQGISSVGQASNQSLTNTMLAKSLSEISPDFDMNKLADLYNRNKVDKDGYFTYAGTKYQYVPTQNRVIKAS